MKSIAKITLPETAMVFAGSFGEHAVGTHASTMELYVHDGRAGSGVIEWDIPSLERTEQIGLTWDNTKTLLDYDGVYALPNEAIAFLKAQGFTVPSDFE